MTTLQSALTTAPPPPRLRLSLGVTGHRAEHAGIGANRVEIERVLAQILDIIDGAVDAAPLVLGAGSLAPTRLHTLLADGTDQLAAETALARGYELVAILPFGPQLNAAINSHPNAIDARALLAGSNVGDPETRIHVVAIEALATQAQVFALADEDQAIGGLYLAKLENPQDFARAQLFAAESSRRVALAGRVMIEQSDIIIGVWDGATTAHTGGTGHTIATALNLGATVIWIDPQAPARWRIMHAPEDLAGVGIEASPVLSTQRGQDLAALVRSVLVPADDAEHPGLAALKTEPWRPQSTPISHAYRRIEALFGGDAGRSPFRNITQHYETPAVIATGSGAHVLGTVRALPHTDPTLADRLDRQILQRFAWADGISAHLSDCYRGGMVVNFILSSLAIVGGVAYLPLGIPDPKWGFALFEFVMLATILVITFLGQKRRWHGRWFEMRRVAEYLRHGPLMLSLGVARPAGQWLRGAETSWPEFYVRHALRDIGLPHTTITPAYLRSALTDLLSDHVVRQRDYHHAKAKRLTAVHHNLDRLSELLFQMAVASVATYLALKGASAAHLIDSAALSHLSKFFTLFGVLFPTFGAGIAGVRYFGDFERFAAISEVTAERLDGVQNRILLLARAPDANLHYGRIAELAHATDDIVVSEIKNWQAVFGGKSITVPA